jgi:hypothetical protein
MENIGNILEGLGGAGLMALHLLTPFLHTWRIHWGASPEELGRTWLGDELVPHPRSGFTHTIAIQAPASSVYAWVAQIGQNKGGFYSYQALENLVGCKISNADRIHPEWQTVNPGDLVFLHPAAGLPVAAVDPGQGYVLHGMIDTQTGMQLPPGTPLTKTFVNVSWLFYVLSTAPNACRLISRWRVDYSPGFKNELFTGRWVLVPIAAVMDFRMLKGIRARAESRES